MFLVRFVSCYFVKMASFIASSSLSSRRVDLGIASVAAIDVSVDGSLSDVLFCGTTFPFPRLVAIIIEINKIKSIRNQLHCVFTSRLDSIVVSSSGE